MALEILIKKQNTLLYLSLLLKVGEYEFIEDYSAAAVFIDFLEDLLC
jgi:hypothetical protein